MTETKPKVDICVYNNADDYKDVSVYVKHPAHPGEYKFNVFLDKETGLLHEGELSYAENDDASFDDCPSRPIPHEVRGLYFNALPNVFAVLNGD